MNDMIVEIMVEVLYILSERVLPRIWADLYRRVPQGAGRKE